MASIATRRRNGITKPRPIWPGYEPKTISNFTNLQDAGNCFRRDAQFEWLKDEIAAERRAQAIQLLQFDFSQGGNCIRSLGGVLRAIQRHKT